MTETIKKQRASDNKQSIVKINKIVFTREKRTVTTDKVLSEQPLQIRLIWQESSDVQGKTQSKVFAITMRTTGNDRSLILGLLFAEGVCQQLSEIRLIEQEQKSTSDYNNNNMWQVFFEDKVVPNLSSMERYQITYSSCGLCGTTSLKALEFKKPPILSSQSHWLAPNTVMALADKMRAAQSLFDDTGSAHAAACFDHQGNLIAIFEDVGRHNALDKLNGYLIEQNLIAQFNGQLVIALSGRISFELVQKVVMVGISTLVAIGAPSDLAIKAAQRFDLTVIGFVTKESFNLYHGEWRLKNGENKCQKI